jgi:hypothetical protein
VQNSVEVDPKNKIRLWGMVRRAFLRRLNTCSGENRCLKSCTGATSTETIRNGWLDTPDGLTDTLFFARQKRG